MLESNVALTLFGDAVGNGLVEVDLFSEGGSVFPQHDKLCLAVRDQFVTGNKTPEIRLMPVPKALDIGGGFYDQPDISGSYLVLTGGCAAAVVDALTLKGREVQKLQGDQVRMASDTLDSGRLCVQGHPAYWPALAQPDLRVTYSDHVIGLEISGTIFTPQLDCIVRGVANEVIGKFRCELELTKETCLTVLGGWDCQLDTATARYGPQMVGPEMISPSGTLSTNNIWAPFFVLSGTGICRTSFDYHTKKEHAWLPRCDFASVFLFCADHYRTRRWMHFREITLQTAQDANGFTCLRRADHYEYDLSLFCLSFDELKWNVNMVQNFSLFFDVKSCGGELPAQLEPKSRPDNESKPIDYMQVTIDGEIDATGLLLNIWAWRSTAHPLSDSQADNYSFFINWETMIALGIPYGGLIREFLRRHFRPPHAFVADNSFRVVR